MRFSLEVRFWKPPIFATGQASLKKSKEATSQRHPLRRQATNLLPQKLNLSTKQERISS